MWEKGGSEETVGWGAEANNESWGYAEPSSDAADAAARAEYEEQNETKEDKPEQDWDMWVNFFSPPPGGETEEVSTSAKTLLN